MPIQFSRRYPDRTRHTAAVEHYRTRAQRRPKQAWDKTHGCWVKA